jgi:hypothetical protein
MGAYDKIPNLMKEWEKLMNLYNFLIQFFLIHYNIKN